MKTIQAHGKYKVSFNTSRGGFDLGESYRYTVDFAGDDIDSLAAEVIADDTSFPMIFQRIDNSDEYVGIFCDAEDHDYVVAIMY